MTLPADISTTADATWPDHKNAALGPFEEPTSGDLFVALADQTGNAACVFRSQDGGHTWARRDAANEPALWTAAGFQCVTAAPRADGTTLEVALVGDAGVPVYASRPFDMTTGLWTETAYSSWGYLPAVSVTGSVPQTYAFRPSDGHANRAGQTTTETVMGSAYRRIRYAYRDAPPEPYDVWPNYITTNSTSEPGTQVHEDLRGAALGSDDRVLLLWTGHTTGTLQARLWTPVTNATAIINPGGAAVSAAAHYPLGVPVVYESGGVGHYAVPYVDGAAVKVLRCVCADAHTAGDWTVETAAAAAGEQTASNPCALVTDGGKLWLFRVTADAGRDVLYCDDAGAGVWTDEEPWKEGAAVVCGGISARRISSGVGVVYLDESTSPARVRYDRLIVLQAFAAQNPGLVVSDTVDLGQAGPNDVTVLLSAGAGAGDAAGAVDFLVEHSPDDSTWAEATRASCEAGAGLRDLVPLSGVDRYLRLSTTVSDTASDVGGAGV